MKTLCPLIVVMAIAVAAEVRLTDGKVYQALPGDVFCKVEEDCNKLPGYCCDKYLNTKDDGSPDYHQFGACVPKEKVVDGCFKNLEY